MGKGSQGKWRNIKGYRFEGFPGRVVLSFEVQDVKILGNFINHLWVPLGRSGSFDVFCQSQIGSQKLRFYCTVVRRHHLALMRNPWVSASGRELGKVGVPAIPGKRRPSKNRQGAVRKAFGSVQGWDSASPLDIYLLHAIQRNALKKKGTLHSYVSWNDKARELHSTVLLHFGKHQLGSKLCRLRQLHLSAHLPFHLYIGHAASLCLFIRFKA